MRVLPSLQIHLHRFLRDDKGAVLVEFAISLPVMLLFFAIMIETARTFWSYQIAIGGVRDATRYMSRVLPLNSCTTLGVGVVAGQVGAVTTIVNDDLGNATTTTVFPSTVTVNSVTPSLTCDTSGAYRNGDVPIITVTANLTLQFPFSFAWNWFGSGLGSATFNIADQARVFGQ